MYEVGTTPPHSLDKPHALMSSINNINPYPMLGTTLVSKTQYEFDGFCRLFSIQNLPHNLKILRRSEV